MDWRWRWRRRLSGCRRESDGFYFRASQFLNVRVKRNQREPDHNPDHEPADILRDTRLRVHPQTIGVDLARANLLQATAAPRSNP